MNRAKLLLQFLAAEQVQAVMVSDLVQPGGEADGWLVPADLFKSLDEHILNSILRFLVTAKQPPAVHENRALVRLNNSGEILNFALLDTPDC
ncbi:hypothetical protein D3C75_1187890 [compost metagenome]